MKSVIKITILLFVLFLVISGFSIYWTFYRLVPSADKDLRLPGLRSEVLVEWDDFDVPHISAELETDLFMAKGYLHARDRLWQMTLKQYKLEGLHSQEIDRSLIPVDRFYLTLSLGEIARKSYELLPRRDKELLQAYADGVNAFVDQNRRHLAPEFSLSSAHPVKWQPWHTIGVKLLWAWEHQQSFWTKLAFTPLHYRQNNAVTRALTGSDVSHSLLFGTGPPVPDSVSYQLLLDDYLQFTKDVYPARTGLSGTGIALSRMSPQPLSMLFVSRETLLRLPDQGYEMVIRSGNGTRAGITIPGFPAMIYGQNESMAWALQPLTVDDGDFYSGKLFSTPPAAPVDWNIDPSVYEHLSEEITLERHILSLKNGGEHQIVTKKSYGRPVVAVSEATNKYLAFDWAGFSVATDVGAFFDIYRAEDVQSLRETIRNISTPALQALFVSSDGRAGRLSAGDILSDPHPLKIRRTSEQKTVSSARFQVPEIITSSGQAVFFEEKPISARRLAGNTCIYSLPWNRSERLIELLDQTPHNQLQNEMTEKWHNDIYSPFAARLTQHITDILSAEASDPAIQIILPYLKNWNYGFGPNETAATIFQLFLNRAARNLFLAFVGEKELNMLLAAAQIPYSAVSLVLSEPRRWPLTHPLTHREWVVTSMREATEMLSESFGSEPHDWQWSRVVHSSFQDVLFVATQQTSISARMAEKNLYHPGNMRVSGSPFTIQALHPGCNHKIRTIAATTMKRIMFLEPQARYYSVLSSGQSANIFYQNYHNQFEIWDKGLLKPPSDPFRFQPGQIRYTQRFSP